LRASFIPLRSLFEVMLGILVVLLFHGDVA